MKYRVVLSLVLPMYLPTTSLAQLALDDALPRIAPSPESNGMGGISSALITEDALAASYNPGHLGLFALGHTMDAGMYLSTPQLNIDGAFQNPFYDAWAGNIGFNLGNIPHTQFPLAFGLGYTKSFLTQLRYEVISMSPTPQFYEASAKTQMVSVGIGIDYIVRFGIGMNYKYVDSRIGEIPQSSRSFDATASSWDIGLILEAPLLRIIPSLFATEDQTTLSSDPFFNIITAYNLRNVGHGFDPGYSLVVDPLPRTATIGLSFRTGMISHTEHYDWEYISVSAGREANDLIAGFGPQDTSFNVNGPGTFIVNDPPLVYDGFAGAIRFFNDVLMGRADGKVEIRSGLQLNLGEILYLRAGSIEDEMKSISTSGYGVRLAGILKLIDHFSPS